MEIKKVKINGNWDIYLPDHRADRLEWSSKEGWERARLDSMHEHLSEGSTILYVGAEEGDMAALCAIWGATVILMEPNPKVWPNIKTIWDANGLIPPFSYQGFASERTTKKTLVVGFPECADGKVIDNHGFYELRNRNAPEMKIDDIEIMFDCMSIDVEGSEWQVLKGAERTMRERQPKIWLSGHPEFMFDHYRQYLTELRGYIKSFGYKETLLDYQHEVHLFYEAR